MKDFEEFRQLTKKSEEDLKQKQRHELAALNAKLDELSRELGVQMDSFEATYKKFEREKNLLAEDLNAKHRKELERLEEKYASNKDALTHERTKLSEKHQAELGQLRNELDEVVARANKEKLEYEANLNKLKAFHEHELEACKQNSSSEYLKLIDVLKANIETMKKQKQSDDVEFAAKYNRKLEEIVSREEEIKSLNDMLAELRGNLAKSDHNYVAINQKVSDLSYLVWINFDDFLIIHFEIYQKYIIYLDFVARGRKKRSWSANRSARERESVVVEAHRQPDDSN